MSNHTNRSVADPEPALRVATRSAGSGSATDRLVWLLKAPPAEWGEMGDRKIVLKLARRIRFSPKNGSPAPDMRRITMK